MQNTYNTLVEKKTYFQVSAAAALALAAALAAMIVVFTVRVGMDWQSRRRWSKRRRRVVFDAMAIVWLQVGRGWGFQGRRPV